MTVPAIEIQHISKTYGEVTAVADVSFTVQQGEVLALLGPNGAGKTTTIEILEGHRKATGGTVRVLGFDPAKRDRQMRARLGIVLQDSRTDPELTPRECVAMFGSWYPDPRPVDEVLELVGLTSVADRRSGRLSGGQQRRLDLALALVGNPDLLFLDEPTTGFDPSARRQAWQLISDLGTLGKTVLLTTHYMDEAEFLADRIVVISDGRVLAEGTPSQLVGPHTDRVRITFRLDGAVVPPTGLGVHQLADGSWRIETRETTATLHDLTRWALDADVELADLIVRRPSLEEIYLDLVGSTPPEPASEGAKR